MTKLYDDILHLVGDKPIRSENPHDNKEELPIINQDSAKKIKEYLNKNYPNILTHTHNEKGITVGQQLDICINHGCKDSWTTGYVKKDILTEEMTIVLDVVNVVIELSNLNKNLLIIMDDIEMTCGDKAVETEAIIKNDGYCTINVY